MTQAVDDGATVKIGNEQIKGKFDYAKFDEIIQILETNNKTR